MSQHTIDEGFNPQTQVRTKTHFEDGDIIVEKSFDAEPYVEYAKAARTSTEGQTWGEGRLVGTIPPAFHAELLAIRDPQQRQRKLREFFRNNPDFVMFSKYLRK